MRERYSNGRCLAASPLLPAPRLKSAPTALRKHLESPAPAISGLSGAAQHSATMAALGGGTMAVGASVLAGIAAAPVLIAAATYEGWRYFKVRRQVNQSIRELNTAISELRDRRPAIIKVTVTAQIQSQNLVRRTAALRTA